jgi:sugar phosphate isomerase/epimerase
MRTPFVSIPNLKGSFPFRFATTSYILPAPILPNIRYLGPYLDEVELVLFESGKEGNLPAEAEIAQMSQLAHELDLTFNVHLPTDVFLGDPDPVVRETACATIVRFYQRTLPLNPTTYVLHLETRSADGREIPDHGGWLARLGASLERLMDQGMDLQGVAVENLSYPLEWVAPLVETMGMRFCLDIGHLLRYGFQLEAYFRSFLAATSMIHLHGVEDGVDHRGLHFIDDGRWEEITHHLLDYRGGLSIEVFSLEDLQPSLARMEEMRRCMGVRRRSS